MSGHNKWAQIKRQKGVEDVKRSKLFSLFSKTISMEAKKSNGDRNAPGLKRAIERARAGNMPNDNIERAIKNATGGGGANYEEVVYEAYGPGGTALILEGITDNRNRSSQEIKHLLSQHGATLAAPGSAAWAFEKSADGWKAKTTVELGEAEVVQLQNLLAALEANEDIKNIYDNSLR